MERKTQVLGKKGLSLMEKQFGIWVGNLGAYNAGVLAGEWISLPCDPDELDKTLENLSSPGYARGAGEELFIADYDGTPFGLDPSCAALGEQASPEELNMLARLMELDEEAAEKVESVLAAGVDAPKDVLGLANWLLEADSLPFFSYLLPEGLSPWQTPEVKMAWTDILLSGKAEVFEENSWIENNFDFEAYGRDLGLELFLGEDGYVDKSHGMPAQDGWDWNVIDSQCYWNLEDRAAGLEGHKEAAL